MFVDDTAALAELVGDVLSARYLRLRLQVFPEDEEREDLSEGVTAKLVCTYRGTGLRYGISSGSSTLEQTFIVPTGAPILLRGQLWPESPPSGFSCRSVSYDEAQEARLTLTLAPEPDPTGPPLLETH